MVQTCVVVGCRNRWEKGSKISWHRFPNEKNPVRREQWLSAINRKNWNPTRQDRVCGKHFVSGSASQIPGDPDYAPSLYLGNPTHRSSTPDVKLDRFASSRARQPLKSEPEQDEYDQQRAASTCIDLLLTQDRKCTGEKRSRSVSPALKGSEADVREKKLKLEVPAKYKTYMPTGTAVTVSSTSATTTATSDAEPPLLTIRHGQEEAVSTQKGANVIYQVSGDQPPVQFILSAEEIKKMQNQKLSNGSVGEDFTKRNPRQTKSNYHWTGDVSCEVILSYDGISERQKMKPRLGPIIQALVKGDYSVLRSDLYQSLTADSKQSSQEMLNSFNYKDDDRQKPITYLSDAKTEVFKVLSLLCMSKARFKDLLDWMKTLKLEEGNQGKYYLSERNVIGGGLRVMYDTDELAAKKMNSLLKLRTGGKAKEKTKLLYPVTTLQSALNPQKPGNFMIMVPTSNAAGTPGAPTAVPSGIPGDAQFSIYPTMQAGQSLVPVTATTNVNQPHPAWSKEALTRPTEPKISLVSLLNKSKSVVSSKSTGTNTTESLKQNLRHPNILRSKSHFHSQKLVPPSGEPIPMHLYRSYKTGTDPEHSKIDHYDETDPDDTGTTPIIVKQEPVEYNNEDEISKHSQEEDEPSDQFKGVLNTDAHMPVDAENSDLNMELVIKTEPVDDYDS
ncbi:uncharacterized protein LOC123551209 isoform X2 [Mercenaria mercenaria]|uniref:uncharacterized protein LOC123551209 isoform X2 n=1 Tax=Mercenaria mercenaria TaxID=6596 RepID=UPI00234F3BC0|nr:uncharacterized protein LOC123551209 isoform X2 [Mercenaria mercenaria]